MSGLLKIATTPDTSIHQVACKSTSPQFNECFHTRDVSNAFNLQRNIFSKKGFKLHINKHNHFRGEQGQWLWWVRHTCAFLLNKFQDVCTIFASVLRLSRLKANDKGDNDKGDNEMIQGAVIRSSGIYLKAEEKPGKAKLDDLQRRLCDQSSPQMRSLTSKWGAAVSMEPRAAAKKKIVWRYHLLLSGFLATGHLLWVSRQSCLSANVKGSNVMTPGALNDLLEFILQLTGKPQLGDPGSYLLALAHGVMGCG